MNDTTSFDHANPAGPRTASQALPYAPLDHLGVLRVSGNDAPTFLQGQLSNDVLTIPPGHARLAGYLTPNGRMLATFWVLRQDAPPAPEQPQEPVFWLVCSRDIAAAIAKRLSMYVLRAKCRVRDVSDSHRVLGFVGPFTRATRALATQQDEVVVSALPEVQLTETTTDMLTTPAKHLLGAGRQLLRSLLIVPLPQPGAAQGDSAPAAAAAAGTAASTATPAPAATAASATTASPESTPADAEATGASSASPSDTPEDGKDSGNATKASEAAEAGDTADATTPADGKDAGSAAKAPEAGDAADTTATEQEKAASSGVEAAKTEAAKTETANAEAANADGAASSGAAGDGTPATEEATEAGASEAGEHTQDQAGEAPTAAADATTAAADATAGTTRTATAAVAAAAASAATATAAAAAGASAGTPATITQDSASDADAPHFRYSEADWLQLDVASGIPWISAATAESFVPQMLNLELAGGVSFKKGCYPGQEVVARSEYRGKVKRRMFAGMCSGPLPEPGTDVLAWDGTPIGQVICVARLSADTDDEALATGDFVQDPGTGELPIVLVGRRFLLLFEARLEAVGSQPRSAGMIATSLRIGNAAIGLLQLPYEIPEG